MCPILQKNSSGRSSRIACGFVISFHSILQRDSGIVMLIHHPVTFMLIVLTLFFLNKADYKKKYNSANYRCNQ